MGKKKSRKDTYWDSEQAQADYELMAAENDRDENKEDVSPLAPETEQIHEEDTDLSLRLDEEEEDDQKSYTYGELDGVGGKALEWIRQSKKEDLPVNKSGLEEHIRGICYSERKVSLQSILFVLVETGVVTFDNLDEGDQPDIDPNGYDGPEIPLETEKFIQDHTQRRKYTLTKDWIRNTTSRSTQRFFKDKLPLQVACYTKIYETMKAKQNDGTLSTFTDNLLRQLSDMGVMKHEIPPADIVNWLEEEEFIKLEEVTKTLKNKVVVTYKVQYLPKIFTEPGKGGSSLIYFLFLLMLVAALMGNFMR